MVNTFSTLHLDDAIPTEQELDHVPERNINDICCRKDEWETLLLIEHGGDQKENGAERQYRPWMTWGSWPLRIRGIMIDLPD